MPPPDALTVAILGVLADEADRATAADDADHATDAAAAEWLSLPRLGKRLGLGASVLLRRLHLMSDAAIGGENGPGWVRVESREGRWMVFITDAGRAVLHASGHRQPGSSR